MNRKASCSRTTATCVRHSASRSNSHADADVCGAIARQQRCQRVLIDFQRMAHSMDAEGLSLTGSHITLEALGGQHVQSLIAAAAVDPSLYQWSPVPQGKSGV